MNPREEGESTGETVGPKAGTCGTRAPSRLPRAPLLAVLLAALAVALLAAAVLFLGSFGDETSGKSTSGDSISAGPSPSVRLTNAAGQVQVEGVEGLDSDEYEATKHATAAGPAAAEERASGVAVDVSREEGSVFVLETDGGRGTGADYGLRVPRGGGVVEVESEAGDVEASGLSGAVAVRAEVGDVTVRDAGAT